MKARSLFGVALLACVPACGGSPTSPAKAVPVANITGTGSLTQGSCVGNSCGYSRFTLRNTGPGCASTLDLSGTVSIRETAGGPVVASAKWEPTLGSKSGGVFHPADSVYLGTMDAVGGDMLWLHGNHIWEITVVQTNVPCS